MEIYQEQLECTVIKMVKKVSINGVIRNMTAEEESALPNYNTFEHNISKLRTIRNSLLTESDWTQSPDSPLTDAKKTEWATYRTSLRNLTNGLTTVAEVEAVTWPTKPE